MWKSVEKPFTTKINNGRRMGSASLPPVSHPWCETIFLTESKMRNKKRRVAMLVIISLSMFLLLFQAENILIQQNTIKSIVYIRKTGVNGKDSFHPINPEKCIKICLKFHKLSNIALIRPTRKPPVWSTRPNAGLEINGA